MSPWGLRNLASSVVSHAVHQVLPSQPSAETSSDEPAAASSPTLEKKASVDALSFLTATSGVEAEEEEFFEPDAVQPPPPVSVEPAPAPAVVSSAPVQSSPPAVPAVTVTTSSKTDAPAPRKTMAGESSSPPLSVARPAPRSKSRSRDTHSLSADEFLENSAYAERARRLMRMVNSMRDAGAYMDLDLPTVVVCGNQSVGKSSVLEALCGIVLPRAEGTCTRCVTEVRLSSGDGEGRVPWSCSVTLRFEYDSAGRPLKAPKEVVFGKEITSKDEVEIVVRRAQKALLNPDKDPNRYLEYRFDNSTAAARDKEALSNELRFSRNIVCLDVKGAATNLTLIDLPGIIRSVDRKDDTQYIDLVQDLVKYYIEKDRAIIVATITCKDEIENQAIVRMAREVDPYGLRTLGVLTKPDTIEAGTHDRWIQVLLGHQFPLQLGYWVVKNPSKIDLDRNITFEDARKKEIQFFATQQPWAGFRHQLDRFGIDSLRRELSRQLTLLTDTSLPDMKARTEEAMQASSMELSKLPPPLGDNARIELLHMVRHFCAIVNHNITAHQDAKFFYQKVRSHFDVFRESVAATRPLFVIDRKTAVGPSTQSSVGSGGGGLTSSISSSISSVLPTWGSGNNANSNGSYDQKQHRDAKKQPAPVDPSEPLDPKKPMTTSDVRRIIEEQKGRELQGYSPYGAFTYVISAFQEDWGKHAQACMQAVSDELHALVAKLTDDVFGRFANLQGQVRFGIQIFQTDLYRTTTEILTNLVIMERRHAFTMGSDEFTRAKSAALAELKAQLELARSAASGVTPKPDAINKAIAALAEVGYTGLHARDLSRLRDTHEDDEVLHVMAASDAYFRLAFRRFGDNVPMTIDYHFLSRFGELLEKELVARLGVLEKDMGVIKGLLMEDRFVAERRRALEERRERLEKVWTRLHEFGV
ncbi:hypothetical protein HK104_000284 [Borealophlyctis nickersoniae]|nr:hypothetical protein HK104_000284 [Borealophlyctis nickersoniae]